MGRSGAADEDWGSNPFQSLLRGREESKSHPFQGLSAIPLSSLGTVPSSPSSSSVAGKNARAIVMGTGTSRYEKVQSEEHGNEVSQLKSSWIGGVYLCAIGSTVVLLLNLALIGTMAGLASRNPSNSGFSSAETVYDGSCSLSSRWSAGLHFIINALSTCILAASNYCMQTLVAPTRKEIDQEHGQGRWLDVGVASFRNLFLIPRSRFALWLVLLLSATPFHLLYNSMIYLSTSEIQHFVVVGPHDLSSQNVWNLTDPMLEKCFKANDQMHDNGVISWHNFASLIADGEYEYMDVQQCQTTLENFNFSDIRGTVFLSMNSSVSDGWSAMRATNFPYVRNGEGRAIAMANQTSNDGNNSSATCTTFIHVPEGPNNIDGGLAGNQWFSYQQCLRLKAQEHCKLLYSPPICIIVSLAALVKVIAMFFAARVHRPQDPPILTAGDAVASFMENPDETTKGMCWLSSRHVKKGNWRPDRSEHPAAPVDTRLFPRPAQWREALNKKRWLATIIACSVSLLVGVISLGNSHVIFSGREFEKLRDTEEANREANAYVRLKLDTLGYLLVANMPQVMITVSYYFYNAALTSMVSAAEYSSYGVNRKPLRVTWPANNSKQRSTYWLSLPYRYGLPVMVLYALLHWLVSESMYYMVVVSYDANDQIVSGGGKNVLAFSFGVLLVAIMVGIVFIGGLAALAFRRLKSTMPIAGSCSVAISAACHPPAGVDLTTAAYGELLWGETDLMVEGFHNQIGEQKPPGHCTFTSLDARPPSFDTIYA